MQNSWRAPGEPKEIVAGPNGTLSSSSSTHENHEYPPCDGCDQDELPPRVIEKRTTYSVTYAITTGIAAIF